MGWQSAVLYRSSPSPCLPISPSHLHHSAFSSPPLGIVLPPALSSKHAPKARVVHVMDRFFPRHSPPQLGTLIRNAGHSRALHRNVGEIAAQSYWHIACEPVEMPMGSCLPRVPRCSMSKSLIECGLSNRLNQAHEPEGGWRLVKSVPRFPSFRQHLRMSNRVSALSSILRSPTRILGIVLMLVFTAEVGVMFLLPHVMPEFLGESGTAVLDAVLLTMVCAPVLWWVIIGPLRRIAIQEHQRSETIVANASEGIITFDSEGRVASCNRASSELLGVDPADWVGKTTQSRMPDFPRSFETLPCEFRINVERQDGTSFPAQVSVSEYPSETGQLRIAIIRDLTEFERAERERLLMARETEALRAQQMATLAQLATGVAHEIRNPLTSIKMLIQVIAASSPTRDYRPTIWNWSNTRFGGWNARSMVCSTTPAPSKVKRSRSRFKTPSVALFN
ncbi:MAG: PAS domain S-box protein [Phycisphaera sp. RhM]|nr:PAS domain S-box protein [Phycisphaera sp. RhM]